MQDQAHNTDLSGLLEDARRRLVETGTRNRLIHVNRSAKRANVLDVIDERTMDVFDLLKMQGKKMRFQPVEEDEASIEDEPLLLAVADIPEEPEAREARYRDVILETRLGPEALQRRLLRLFTDARTAEEEQGVNILYLAMGFLRWYESDSSEVMRESPLILVPVELVRDDRRATFNLRARDTEIVTNLPLQERLRADFGFELPEITDDESFLPEIYVKEVLDRISGRARWTIDQDGMQLGFFSFSKLLMMRDLEPENWPEDAFGEHPVLSGLLDGGFESSSPLFGPKERLDPRLEPGDLLHVVAADASQTRVIEEVRAGRNLVVQGPPGTGKSQTIANIIAAAAYDGKRILFVAEKMAALSVVHDRLKKVGLGDLCLEIHSRAANKRALLEELARTLAAGAATPNMPPPPDALRDVRDKLNAVADLLHEPVPGYGFTPFRAMAEIACFVGQDAPPPRIPRDELAGLDDATRRDRAERIKAYAEMLAQTGPRAEHPFFGVGAIALQPTDLQRLEPELARAADAIVALRETLARLAKVAGQPVCETFEECEAFHTLLTIALARPKAAQEATQALLSSAGNIRVSEALEAGSAWAAAQDQASTIFTEAAFGTDADGLRARLAPGVGSFWSRLFGSYRSASQELATLLTGPIPKAPADRLKLIDRLILVRRMRRALSDEEGFLSELLGVGWRGERTPFAALQAQGVWLARLTAITSIQSMEELEQICAAADGVAELDVALKTAQAEFRAIEERLNLHWEAQTLALLDARIAAMRNGIGRYGEWSRLSTFAARLVADGMSDLLDLVDKGTVRRDHAVDEFLYASAEARWDVARSTLPELDGLAQLDRHALVESFRGLETARMDETRRLVRAKHLGQLPTGAAGPMGFLRGEMAKQRRHKPIRQIMRAAGQMVQRIKPVFLMSPISIAQYLPPGSTEFDILLIDEASQVRPEDALGAIVRCKQIVVVGDQKQLPPTSFFDRVAASGEDDNEDEDEEVRAASATEMESVLTLCEARGLNPAMLEWHYRSRDPSLITVNNAEFYEHRLILPPSPVQNDPDYGLAFRRVPGVYSSRSRGGGRPGTNRIEAEAVARAVAEHARTRPDLSLGIVAFSKAQSDMLTEVLEIARREDEILDAFLREGRAEDVFVKNIENVQGDERDVILISVGYGPSEPNGRLASMAFGPVNGEGGERRLNVLFSRARTRCLVFCSFDPNDIDTARTSRDGPRVLKRFLEYARSGQLAQPEVTGAPADSPFEEDVASVIRNLGYPCDHQVGAAGFKIDLGVRHPNQPGRYILAVECDGATYHSALWARERDRLRQDVLEGLGWRFHRIWSTDWFHRRHSEVDRLRVALDLAVQTEGPDFAGTNRDGLRPPTDETTTEAKPETVLPPPPDLTASTYKAAKFSINVSFEPHEAPLHLLVDLVTKIVEVEGPVHNEVIARRVAEAFGKARTGRRIREASDRALSSAVRAGAVIVEEDFAFTGAQQAAPPVRDRASAEAPGTAGHLPTMEIQVAAAQVVAECGDMPVEELIVATARLLGFARVGADLRGVIEAALR
ncbi:DUF3320 domain-containing protein [Roseinatronobacter sp.]|uniref:DUF3320 domain-containing protein n=1 Tax=Roseinatronobacter sp. TaxID=1945755 RepID=UPI0025E66BEC|nr:DUF3320 domain-containing protein [Roseibaca sp.]